MLGHAGPSGKLSLDAHVQPVELLHVCHREVPFCDCGDVLSHDYVQPGSAPARLSQEAVGARDAEVAAMRGALQQYEAKIRALELSNYSLSLHLRQATGPPGSHGGLGPLDRRPPDVY